MPRTPFPRDAMFEWLVCALADSLVVAVMAHWMHQLYIELQR